LAWLHVLAARAAAEEFEAMRLNLKARATSGLGGYGVNAAVIYLGDCAARDADEVVVVRRLTWDVGVSAVGEVNPFDQVLVGEEF
jgi:hypothetical protein